MHSFNPIEFVKIAEISRNKRISKEKIFHAAGQGALPLFVSIPKDVCAYRIDIQHNDLASRTQLFINPQYDQHDSYRPILLRLKPADCAKLATKDAIEAVDFPYAICLVATQLTPLMNDGEHGASPQSFTTKQIPPNQEIFPLQLNSVPVCWRLFHPDTEDLSNFLSLAVTTEMVVTRDDYIGRIAPLKKKGRRKEAEKSTSGYINRHERPRKLIVEIAEKVAADNESDCSTLRGWVDLIYELRDTKPFAAFHLEKPTFSRQWLENLLRKQYEFINGKPVKKPDGLL